jgi:hypothetical protein
LRQRQKGSNRHAHGLLFVICGKGHD